MMESDGRSVRTPSSSVASALSAFRAGRPVLIHDSDDREDEIDMVYPAGAVSPGDVAVLRNDVGGLVCVALSYQVAEIFDLPFVADLVDHPAGETDDVGYDSRSSFSLTVNHRDTYTGVTDRDRAKTIRELARAARHPVKTDFTARFRSPGHVHLLKAAPGLLAERQGHTELGIALALAAGREPAAVVCEMLDDETGGALATGDARSYAVRHEVPFVEGRHIVEELRGVTRLQSEEYTYAAHPYPGRVSRPVARHRARGLNRPQ